MPSIILLPVLLVAGALGVAAHELTHYAVWTVLGRDARFDPGRMATVADVERIRLGDRVAALAPLVVGGVFSYVVIASGVFTAAWLPFLGFYTLGGVWLGGGIGSDIKVALTRNPAG